ncbi:leucyl aminopeptidase [Propionivibrio dicarboxylicus]|uniref:Probable cytosol aminopeptidase n=1 Tax=Propionivibrio dicarboxylicus TaxID=83767 RepID=A0A1G7ZT29_9RHOO|nr:leucyl aminopeptidase [Propionivibrio dicarboxylicus]SDH11845.1 leucyl aminopeptidase [Propionivibrio dicarboxylicus]
MEFSIKSASLDIQPSACTVVGVFESGLLAGIAKELDTICGNALSKLVEGGDFEGRSGTSLMLHHVPSCPSERILLIGLGKAKTFRDKDYCAAIRTAFKALRESGAADAALTLTALPLRKRSAAWKIRQAAMISQEIAYRFDRFKSKKNDKVPTLNSVVLLVDSRKEIPAAESALAQGLAIGAGVSLARDLGNTPGNVCTPDHLAETARQLALEHSLGCDILERAEIEKLGMNAFLSVARGSHQPSKFIVLEYNGTDSAKNRKPVVFIGKGITFDSGGISLKPGEGMDEMKYDMCGAASVLGALKAVAQMKLPLRLVIIVPTTENMPGGNASKPGDIVTSMSGQTIEILNTDAEGRLILCDALSYAERFKPDAVIDVATLTGACVIALGHVASGLFANDDDLADDLRKAGDHALDRVWQLPLWEDYQEQLKSNFADMANIGGRPGGSITAACFLSRFAEKFDWAHLDIAGTAWKSGADKGATGRPVPLLVHYLLGRAGKLD